MSDRKEYKRQWAKDNHKRVKKLQKQWLKDNPEYKRQYAYTPRGRFIECKRSARKRGFIFKITFDEFVKIINQSCHYCGGEGYGLDRLDNSMGYLKDNIVSCCSMCNYMKKTYTESEFINQCIKISNKWKKGSE